MTHNLTEAEVGRLTSALEKTFHEVARLRRDIRQLADRVEAFEDEPKLGYPHPVTFVSHRAEDLFDAIHTLRDSIFGCEAHINVIRSHMDIISNDVLSREEMKPWIKRGSRASREKDSG